MRPGSPPRAVGYPAERQCLLGGDAALARLPGSLRLLCHSSISPWIHGGGGARHPHRVGPAKPLYHKIPARQGDPHPVPKQAPEPRPPPPRHRPRSRRPGSRRRRARRRAGGCGRGAITCMKPDVDPRGKARVVLDAAGPSTRHRRPLQVLHQQHRVGVAHGDGADGQGLAAHLQSVLQGLGLRPGRGCGPAPGSGPPCSPAPGRPARR